MDEETETDTKKKEKRIDLSVAQVAGSALAAAVAAYLAGQLGVYGTIIGAGLISVVATTGGSIFHHLFRRTGEQIKEASVATRPKPRRFSSHNRSTTADRGQAGATMVLPTFDKQGTEDKVTSVAAKTSGPGTVVRTQQIPRAEQARRRDPASAHPAPYADEATRMLRPDAAATRALRAADTAGPGRPADRTQRVPRLDERTIALGQAAAGPAGAPPTRHPLGSPEEPEELSTTTYGTRLRGWKRPALGALAVFVLAMGGVTATELLTGQTPSGAQGTTLGNLTQTGGGSRQQPSTPQPPGTGHSPGDGSRQGGSDGPTPDPHKSGDSGTGKGTENGTPAPTPSPSDGGTSSPDTGTSPSPNPSPSGSAGDAGSGGSGDGSTGGEHQQGQPEAEAQVPEPGAS